MLFFHCKVAYLRMFKFLEQIILYLYSRHSCRNAYVRQAFPERFSGYILNLMYWLDIENSGTFGNFCLVNKIVENSRAYKVFCTFSVSQVWVLMSDFLFFSPFRSRPPYYFNYSLGMSNFFFYLYVDTFTALVWVHVLYRK